jgi:hypothetical protein
VGDFREPIRTDMALDHYISQVHLRNFYSPVTSRLCAIRKSDLKRFPPRSEDVCRIEEGSTNSYLRMNRAIEEFLRIIEPRYNPFVVKLREGRIDQECIYTIAGFVAYIIACSPAGMRIHSGPLEGSVYATAAILERQGILENAPPSLGGKSFLELVEDGVIGVKVDPKFPQALGITSIISWLSVFGNSHWEILHNSAPDSPFFTSDYPIAIEPADDMRVLTRLCPLAPDLAVRIIPDIRLSGSKPDLSFPSFSHVARRLKAREVRQINQLIVRSAEDTIFYQADHDWIEPFVSRNRHYRIEPVTSRIPDGRGFLVTSTSRIVAHRKG